MEWPSFRVALQSRYLLFRETLAACLRDRQGFTVVGHTAGLADLANLCDLRRPDVVLVDLSDPDPGLATALRSLHVDYPDVGLVGVYDQPAVLAWANQAGVSAAVPASHGLHALLAVLREHACRHSQPVRGRLTDGELAVVWLMNAGHSVAEMADALGISRYTVENRKRQVYAKLGAHSQSHAIARTASLGLGLPSVDGIPGAMAPPALAARESDILRSVGRGDSVRQTARALGIAIKTVETTQARMFRKLGVRNRAEALAVAHRLGMLADSAQRREPPRTPA